MIRIIREYDELEARETPHECERKKVITLAGSPTFTSPATVGDTGDTYGKS